MRKTAQHLKVSALLVASLYLTGDLVFNGPARRWFDSRRSPARAESVARVFGQTISPSQLERAVSDHLWLQGQSPDKESPDAMSVARQTALDGLIDEILLNHQAAELPASESEINARISRFLSRFENKAALETAMMSQGIPNEAVLRDRMTAQIRREKFVEMKIKPSIRTTDEEARKWFEQNQAKIAQPERLKVRHLFIPTLAHPPEEAKQKLVAALAELAAGKKDFATLANEVSEDPASKEAGGDLGWMTRSRLPADFAAPVFGMPTGKPALVRTKLGWHVVEVTDRKPAAPQTFEQAKPEILAALETSKRRKAVADLRQSLRKEHAADVQIASNPKEG